MPVPPILEETAGRSSGPLLSSLAGWGADAPGPAVAEATGPGNRRSLAIYAASAGFDLVDELDHLCARSIEPNIFFNPRFLAPAMPRLEDKEIRLAVIRDGDAGRSRLRLLLPFSVERPPVPFAAPIMRAWANPFGPLGTPLVDHDDPEGVISDFFSMMAQPHLKLPGVFLLPDVRLDGPFATILGAFAASRNLTLVTVDKVERPFLQSQLDGETYLRNALRPHHVREFRRMRRRLAETGTLEYRVARHPDEIRLGVESFLALEAAGWKGRERTAMAVDRFRAAFAREAVYRLAERDLCRVHSLTLDGKVIACLIVFIEAGIAYTWKTAYDETYAAFSPGTLLMMDVTCNHLDDPNILGTDSCAAPGHPVMSRIWTERRPVGTLVVGLTPGADRMARQAASQIHLHRETRNIARQVGQRLRRALLRR